MRMNIIMKAILCLVLFFFLSILVKGKMSCTPAEENKNHTISFMLPSKAEKNDIRIVSMFQHIGTCHPNTQICANSYSDKFNITMTSQKYDQAVTVLIYNLSRKLFSKEKQWFRAYYENSITDNKSICNVTVFAKPEDITCMNSIFHDYLYVTCIAHKIYPNGICLHRMSINNPVDKPILTEMCSARMDGDPEYFTSICTFGFLLSALRSGTSTLNITIYPNVTNDESDVQYGMEFVHSFILGPPNLIHATKESHTPAFQTSNLNGTVSVEINMICFPKPKAYRLIKEDGSEIKFDQVKNGNAASDG
ncbi:unnamed protein product, partial [Lymnaea stagnalis]